MVNNANKYSHPQGVVERAAKTVTIEATRLDNGQIKISVADQGIGLLDDKGNFRKNFWDEIPKAAPSQESGRRRKTDASKGVYSGQEGLGLVKYFVEDVLNNREASGPLLFAEENPGGGSILGFKISQNNSRAYAAQEWEKVLMALGQSSRHDLKNLLFMIKGYTGLLQDALSESNIGQAEHNELLQNIFDLCSKMQENLDAAPKDGGSFVRSEQEALEAISNIKDEIYQAARFLYGETVGKGNIRGLDELFNPEQERLFLSLAAKSGRNSYEATRQVLKIRLFDDAEENIEVFVFPDEIIDIYARLTGRSALAAQYFDDFDAILIKGNTWNEAAAGNLYSLHTIQHEFMHLLYDRIHPDKNKWMRDLSVSPELAKQKEKEQRILNEWLAYLLTDFRYADQLYRVGDNLWDYIVLQTAKIIGSASYIDSGEAQLQAKNKDLAMLFYQFVSTHSKREIFAMLERCMRFDTFEEFEAALVSPTAAAPKASDLERLYAESEVRVDESRARRFWSTFSDVARFEREKQIRARIQAAAGNSFEIPLGPEGITPVVTEELSAYRLLAKEEGKKIDHFERSGYKIIARLNGGDISGDLRREISAMARFTFEINTSDNILAEKDRFEKEAIRFLDSLPVDFSGEYRKRLWAFFAENRFKSQGMISPAMFIPNPDISNILSEHIFKELMANGFDMIVPMGKGSIGVEGEIKKINGEDFWAITFVDFGPGVGKGLTTRRKRPEKRLLAKKAKGWAR